MLGLISGSYVAGRGCGYETNVVEALGVRCVLARIYVGERTGRRRAEGCLDGCAERLRRLRAARVVLGEGFPFRDGFLKRGFTPAGCGALLSAKAGEVAAAGAARHQRALLSTLRADGNSVRAARELVRRFRYLVIDAPEDVFERLGDVCGEYGVTPERLGAGRFADVDGAAFLAPPEKPVYAPARCAAVFAGGGQKLVLGGREVKRISFTLPERYSFDLPFPAAPILSWAMECGSLPPEQVEVTGARCY